VEPVLQTQRPADLRIPRPSVRVDDVLPILLDEPLEEELGDQDVLVPREVDAQNVPVEGSTATHTHASKEPTWTYVSSTRKARTLLMAKTLCG
jgi:hypothetical protein